MKKFEHLGRSLSKDEQKKIMGGLNAPIDGYGDSKTCTTNGDCGSKEIPCRDGTTNGSGVCYQGNCRWVGVC